jgi:hypothetical protein
MLPPVSRMVCEPCMCGRTRREAVTGGLGPPLGPLGRLRAVLAPCVSCDVADATSQDTRCRATQSILYLGASLGTNGRSTRHV